MQTYRPTEVHTPEHQDSDTNIETTHQTEPEAPLYQADHRVPLKMDALVHLRKKRRRRSGGVATSGEPLLTTSVWVILYADDAGVISQ